jgi:hypothetical protein
MWTLAHAHGTFLGLLNITFAATLALRPGRHPRRRALASSCLLGATVALPAGFLFGGLVIHGGDPGLGIVLVPPEAVLLLAAIVLTAA